jgi:hypothetical protein
MSTRTPLKCHIVLSEEVLLSPGISRLPAPSSKMLPSLVCYCLLSLSLWGFIQKASFFKGVGGRAVRCMNLV